MEYRQRIPTRAQRLDAEAAGFLARLSAIERRSIPAGEMLGQAKASLHQGISPQEGLVSAVFEWLVRRSSKGCKVWLHRNHGDFAPWNSVLTERGFFVFDWEESLPAAGALGDAFYYRVAPAIHIAQNPAVGQVFSSALELAAQVAQRMAGVAIDVPFHFGLWALTRLGSSDLYKDLLRRLLAAYP